MFRTRVIRACASGRTYARAAGALSACAVLSATGAEDATASRARHGREVQGTCEEVRLAPGAACITPYWVQAEESWLIAAEDEPTGGMLCVYLARWDGGSYVREISPMPTSCNSEPTILTSGVTGHPAVYNGTGHWATVTLAVFH